jgi:hypothetical protein
MTGFIHVPPLAGEGMDASGTLKLRQLVNGATLIIETCVESWGRGKRKGPASLPGPVRSKG